MGGEARVIGERRHAYTYLQAYLRVMNSGDDVTAAPPAASGHEQQLPELRRTPL
jgi:hypothetical protein